MLTDPEGDAALGEEDHGDTVNAGVTGESKDLGDHGSWLDIEPVPMLYQHESMPPQTSERLLMCLQVWGWVSNPHIVFSVGLFSISYRCI